MYQCNDCGAEFDLPARLDTDDGGMIDTCPLCGSDDILAEVDNFEELDD